MGAREWLDAATLWAVFSQGGYPAESIQWGVRKRKRNKVF
jgi:hypothetical protein